MEYTPAQFDKYQWKREMKDSFIIETQSEQIKGIFREKSEIHLYFLKYRGMNKD